MTTHGKLLLLFAIWTAGLGACTGSHETASDASVRDAGAAGDAGNTAGPDAAAADGGEARDCVKPSDCAIVSAGCCGACGKPTASDVVAIRADAVAARQKQCRDSLCPACASMINPALIATCRQAKCEVVDIEADAALSGCKTDGDCRVRATECCECGANVSPYALIAVRVDAEAAYTTLVCSQTACDECAPIYPASVTAVCKTPEKHCAAVVQ